MTAVELYPRACPVCASMDKKNIFAQENFNANQWEQYSFASRKLPENNHFRLILCPVCQLLYADPVPSMDKLFKTYTESSFDSGIESLYASQSYQAMARKIIHRLPDLDKVLDVGTGDGRFLERLIELGFKSVTGIEPSRAPIQAANPAIRRFIKEGFFRSSDFEPESFSLITCFQTFEHLYDPLETCMDFYKLLKPGGAIFLVFHDRLALPSKIMGLKSPIYDVEHLQLFSKESASYLLNKSGFRSNELETLVNRYPVDYWARLVPFPKYIKPRILSFLDRSSFGKLPLALPAGNFGAIAFK